MRATVRSSILQARPTLASFSRALLLAGLGYGVSWLLDGLRYGESRRLDGLRYGESWRLDGLRWGESLFRAGLV